MTANAAVVAALRTDPDFAPLRRSLDVYYGDPAHDYFSDRKFCYR